MESKKRFGEYICHRRKELGLTQREFADKLYVTESAVSKWERGLSYPDVTLLRDICAVLDVSEHELLTASVDTERRTAERLAEKYLRLTRTYRAVQYVIYGAVLLGCAVGNLAVQGTLSWFWVALPAVLLAASLTLVPALAGLRQELAPCRASIALGCALASLELLLGACCLYTGGDWFPMVGMSVLFGLSLFISPVVLRQLSLPVLEGRRLSVYLLAEAALLELGPEDVMITGANLIDAFGGAAMLAGSPGGNDGGRTIAAMASEGFQVIIAAGLEKLIPGTVGASILHSRRKGVSRSRGMACGLFPVAGQVVTEWEAIRMVAAVEACPIGRGGINGAEGGSVFQAWGPAEELEKLERVLASCRDLPVAGEAVSLEECAYPCASCGGHLSCCYKAAGQKKKTVPATDKTLG